MKNIRNFCIIAHVDHGKSTLADRMLEVTHTVEKHDMRAQFLDTLDLERERGITIKLQAVRMNYLLPDITEEFVLNLIDTPGHVDFTYEVTRSLAACEGAILLVDATQGIQAQTLAHAYKAMEQDLVLIPVVNKIDLPAAQPEVVSQELIDTFGFRKDEIFYTSGKTGEGVEDILKAVVDLVPAPSGNEDAPARALVFDSFYDLHKGVVALVRIVDGEIEKNSDVQLVHSKESFLVQEIGFLQGKMRPQVKLTTGEVGYLVSGVKNISQVRVGDTITQKKKVAEIEPLAGYKQIKPLVYASLYPVDTDDYKNLRDAIDKLSLNDAALTYEPANSKVLGFGFKCGFLGLLHVDIIKERLERELGVDVLVTTPTVAFEEGKEQWVKAQIITPTDYIGGIMQVCNRYRGEMLRTDNLFGQAGSRVLLTFELPLLSIMTDFYDQLKSASAGFASLEYELIGYRDADIVTLSILINSQEIDALSIQTVRPLALEQGR
ncbi:translation elongation factor 4, partial [candidate division WWE3 bacterium]|nr:translation elongation factor 4 [candidate division WWE3 bacterium]